MSRPSRSIAVNVSADQSQTRTGQRHQLVQMSAQRSSCCNNVNCFYCSVFSGLVTYCCSPKVYSQYTRLSRVVVTSPVLRRLLTSLHISPASLSSLSMVHLQVCIAKVIFCQADAISKLLLFYSVFIPLRRSVFNPSSTELFLV